MNTTSVKIEMCVSLQDGEKLDKFIPFKAHCGDVAFDLMNAGDDIEILPGSRVLVKTGFKMELEDGWEAQIRPRSGNAIKKGITVLNTPGTIDSQYRGEVGVVLINTDKESSVIIGRGDKIAQMVIQRVPSVEIIVVDSIDKETERGSNGFGSTGIAGKTNSIR